MKPITLENELSHLFESHGLGSRTEKEWVLPLNKLPAIRATWYPGERYGLLEVDILLEDERIITEGFAGFGAGSDGIKDAFYNFCVNSFHVLLAALWDEHELEQVTIESWTIMNKKYTAFIGDLGTRGGPDMSSMIPKSLGSAIENSIKGEALQGKLYWFRFFLGNVSGDHTFEVLKNNEAWEEGKSALKSLEWVKASEYYSVRNFIVLKENQS